MVLFRKGQGSLEFLMTYGWVMLVILLAVVVLWEWGLFSIGQRIEPGSFGFWGLAPQQGNEFILDDAGTLKISLVNTVGANISILSCNATIEKSSKENAWGLGAQIIQPGKTFLCTLTNPDWANNPSGRRFDAQIILTYTDNRTGDNVHQSSGMIWGTIEPKQ